MKGGSVFDTTQVDSLDNETSERNPFRAQRVQFSTREFQTQLLHCFSKSDNKSNHQSINVNTLATVSKSTHSIRGKKTLLMACCVRVVWQFLFIGLVGLKVSSSIDIWSLLQQICEQMHRTDSYSKVIWCKSGELDGRMISAVVVWISSVGHLLHLILHLNPSPDEGTPAAPFCM